MLEQCVQVIFLDFWVLGSLLKINNNTMLINSLIPCFIEKITWKDIRIITIYYLYFQDTIIKQKNYRIWGDLRELVDSLILQIKKLGPEVWVNWPAQIDVTKLRIVKLIAYW